MRREGEARPPATVDEIPWDDPAGTPTSRIQVATPRKCKHPRDRRVVYPTGAGSYTERIEKCGACGHVFDPEIQRRGRNVRKYGKAAELHAARRLGLEPRGTSRDPEDAGGAMDPAVLQSKTGPGFASIAWIRELEALEMVAKGRPRILLAAEKPGRGSRKGGDRNARRLVVMFEDEFVRLTGLDARRRNLEELVEIVQRVLADAESQHPGGWGPDVTTVQLLREGLAALEKTPVR